MERTTMYFESVNGTKLEGSEFNELSFEDVESAKDVGYTKGPHIQILGKEDDHGHTILGVIKFSSIEAMKEASKHLEKFLNLASDEEFLTEK